MLKDEQLAGITPEMAAVMTRWDVGFMKTKEVVMGQETPKPPPEDAQNRPVTPINPSTNASSSQQQQAGNGEMELTDMSDTHTEAEKEAANQGIAFTVVRKKRKVTKSQKQKALLAKTATGKTKPS